MMSVSVMRLMVPAAHVSPSPDASAVFDLCLAWILRLSIVAEFEAAARVVPAPTVAIQLILRRRARVSHRGIALAGNVAPDWRDVSHCCVGVGCLRPTRLVHILDGVAHLKISSGGLLPWVTICHCADMLTPALLFVNLSEAAIKRVLAVLGHRLVDLALVGLGRFQALRDVLAVTSVVGRVNFLCFAPPARIDNRVDASGAGSLLFLLMRVVDLESALGSVPGDAAHRFLGALAAPGRRRLLDDVEVGLVGRAASGARNLLIRGRPIARQRSRLRHFQRWLLRQRLCLELN